MLGIKTAKRALEEKVARPAITAVLVSIAALIMALIAVMIGVSK